MKKLKLNNTPLDSLHDIDQRQQALDITRSFIVQAPAGSGKTELLTRRFVNLLTHSVNNPEEIIAITFTRKAAAEMRHRVISLLPDCHSHRLRIMTIDAFCAFLCAQMPLKSKLSQQFRITENAENLYQKAIDNLFLYHQENFLEDFLLYLDNDSTRVKDLFLEILKNRDQWLPHVFNINAIDELEQGLQNVIAEAQTKTLKYLSPQQLAELQAKSENIASLFLTKQDALRKKLPIGFDDISEEFEAHLKDLQYLPSKIYSSSQKTFILALSQLLPLLIAELQLVFKETGEVDFIEVALRASEALGDENNPTDLNLRLDYQIKHLLIDEFQDTSITQWRLLQKITAGWEPNDGRTLFLVGDPMQSIYRFRKAEVGLFLEVQKHGINQIILNSLTLSSNFRSSSALINWFNLSFENIFPKHSDAFIGAIAYSPSDSIEKNIAENAVFYHPIDNQEKSEAENILDIIHQYPQASIGILVRSRSHLKNIIPLLHNKNIAFRAVEIANLADHPLIEDLFALTKALLHPADRIAWLSILRAPWCGLTLENLHQISENHKEKTILDNLITLNKAIITEKNKNITITNSPNIYIYNKELSIRITHFLQAIQWAMEERGRLCLRDWIEKTWLKLKGNLCLSNSQELKIAELYFDLLDNYQDISSLQKQLSFLSLPTETSADINIDIMTIHKAKGLEFDVVILPGLDKATRAESSKLFLWTERLNIKSQSNLLIAPIRASGETRDEIYNYLNYEENKRQTYELQRLFYVACTRAKHSLHLLFSANIKSPCKNSFLAQLWPLISENINLKSPTEKNTAINFPSSLLLKRLPIELINKPYFLEITAKLERSHNPLVTSSQKQQKYIGIIVHEILQLLSQNLSQQNILSEEYIKIRLLQLSGSLEGYDSIQSCLENIKQDPKAAWILKAHIDAQSEYSLSALLDKKSDNKIINIIIDRTFIDENNYRWIIDYKITDDISQEEHREQLEKYAAVFKKIETRPIYLGLYFPKTCDWVEWEYSPH